MNGQKRYSLTTRLESTEGSLLAEMTKWFNRMPIEEKREKVKEALLMTYWPLVKADAGAEQEELEKCYWEFEQWFYRYRFVLRQRLNLQEPFHWSRDLTAQATKYMTKVQEEDDDDEQGNDDETEVESSKNQLIGGGQVKNAGSIFDGFG